MKEIGFVFSSMPHGDASGREGLDAVLSTSNYTQNMTLFFIGDGVMQLLCGQKPDLILCRDYISTFKMLPLCDVENIYVCENSLIERGLKGAALIINAHVISSKALSLRINQCAKLVHF